MFARVNARLDALRRRVAADPRWTIILGVYAVVCALAFDQIDEDAFIYFRVAANIGEGYGYVYNRGGERIEVGSSIVWQYLLAFVHFLGLDVVVFSKLLGIAAGAVALNLVWRLSRCAISNSVIAVFPAVLLAATSPFYCGAERGLETASYALAVVALAYAIVEERLQRYWWVPAAVLVLTRSEGFIGLMGLGGFFYFERRAWKEHAPRLAAVLAVIASVCVWRFFYFHDLVPHAFYLKMYGAETVGRDAASIFLWQTGLWIPLGVASMGLFSRSAWDRTTITLAAYSVPFVCWALTFQAGMAQYNRHLVPALCIAYVMVGRGLDVLVSRWPRVQQPLVALLTAYAAWLALGANAVRGGFAVVENPARTGLKDFVSDPRRVAENLRTMVTNRPRRGLTIPDLHSQRLESTWMYLFGDFIRRSYPKGITVVFDQAGQTPWYAGLDKPFIDPYGLANRGAGYAMFNDWLGANSDPMLEVYRHVSLELLGPWHEAARTWNFRQAADYVFGLRPHLIIISMFSQPHTKRPETRFRDDSELAGVLATDPRLKNEYVDRPKWYMHWYHRKDIAAAVQWVPGEEDLPGKIDMTPELRAEQLSAARAGRPP